MFINNLIKKTKSVVDRTKDIDKKFFAQVMDEIENGVKDKGCEGKSIAMSSGDEAKANSLYIEIRAKEIKENFLNKQRLLITQAEERKKKNQLSKVLQERNKSHKEEEITHYLRTVLRTKGFNYVLDLYKDELASHGLTRTPWYSPYHLKNSNSKFAVRIYEIERELKIIDKNNKIVLSFNLLDKLEYPKYNENKKSEMK